MIIATRIETGLWRKILHACIAQGWRIAHEYDGFDKGIDHDFIFLKLDDEEMYFGWSNWFEGEIKCTQEQLVALEERHDVHFATLEPEVLSDRLIELYLKTEGS